MKTLLLGKLIYCALLGALLLAGANFAQPAQAQAQRRVSPRRTVELPLPGNKKVTIDYGSPNAGGRKVFGELVPYDQVWRLGANKATHLTTDADLVIGGQNVPAGTYSLFVIPSKDKWTLMVNKATGMWGIPYKPEYDQTILVKIDMKVEQLSHPIDRFIISLDRVGTENWLVCEWENTRASVSFTAK